MNVVFATRGSRNRNVGAVESRLVFCFLEWDLLMIVMQRRGKMKVEKSDDCRSKPLESEDGMTSAAQVRETDSR